VDQHVGRHGDVLGVSAAVREAEDCIAFLETALAIAAQLLDRARELDAHGGGSLGRQRVVALTLHEIHTVETKGLFV
jgi:hypothetical protein